MTGPEFHTPEEFDWGSPEILSFFHKWTERHMTNGVFFAYLAAIQWLATHTEPEETELILNSSLVELPLLVSRGYDIQYEDGSAGRSVDLQRINPRTGEAALHSLYCFGELREDGSIQRSDIQDEASDFFSDHMLGELAEQLREQDALGIVTD